MLCVVLCASLSVGDHVVCHCQSRYNNVSEASRDDVTGFDRVLIEYTREGFRVIALACADLDHLTGQQISSYSQPQLEGAAALRLVGLAVMANPLRPDSAGVIESLLKAQVGLHECG